VTLLATSAFAPSFTHTTVAPDVVLTFASGVSPVNVSLTTGTYRMCLAPAASDYLRALEVALKSAIVAARGSGSVVTVSLTAAGIVSYAFTVDVPASVTFAAPMWRALGFSAAAPTITAGVITGTLPVWYLALLSSTRHGPWQPRQAGGAERTNGGAVYAFAASATSWQRSHAVILQPTTPAQRSAQGADATALLPAPEYMGAVGAVATAREWSVLDVLYASRNAACGLALDNWQTVRTSTSERLYLGYIGPASLLSPAFTAQDDAWDAWAEWTLDVVLPTSGASITRA
jgi:hypothetical protein